MCQNCVTTYGSMVAWFICTYDRARRSIGTVASKAAYSCTFSTFLDVASSPCVSCRASASAVQLTALQLVTHREVPPAYSTAHQQCRCFHHQNNTLYELDILSNTRFRRSHFSDSEVNSIVGRDCSSSSYRCYV